MIDIKGLDKAKVLAALYNNSQAQGMGFLHYKPEDMSYELAKELLMKQTYFDYLYGRVMKINLKSDDSFDEWGYDRDLGQGAAARVIETLRQSA